MTDQFMQQNWITSFVTTVQRGIDEDTAAKEEAGDIELAKLEEQMAKVQDTGKDGYIVLVEDPAKTYKPGDTSPVLWGVDGSQIYPTQRLPYGVTVAQAVSDQGGMNFRSRAFRRSDLIGPDGFLLPKSFIDETRGLEELALMLDTLDAQGAGNVGVLDGTIKNPDNLNFTVDDYTVKMGAWKAAGLIAAGVVNDPRRFSVLNILRKCNGKNPGMMRKMSPLDDTDLMMRWLPDGERSALFWREDKQVLMTYLRVKNGILLLELPEWCKGGLPELHAAVNKNAIPLDGFPLVLAEADQMVRIDGGTVRALEEFAFLYQMQIDPDATIRRMRIKDRAKGL